MLMLVAGGKDGTGSICAVNLACQIANLDSTSTDRWQGENSVVLVDAGVEGTATRCCSGGHLPVSGQRLSPGDLKDVERWIQGMRTIVMEVDYVVVDGSSDIDVVTKAVVGISDLVVVPCSVSSVDLMTIVPIMELIKVTRLDRLDGAPKCLLVPMDVHAGTAPGKEIETALRRFGEPVGPVIHQWAEFADAFNAGRWIGDFAPKGRAHEEIKALAASAERMLPTVKVSK